MKGLRIVPLLVILLICIYLGVYFVEQNQEAVILSVGKYHTPPTRLGFVVMTSVLIGIFIGTLLAVVQLVALVVSNRSLKKRLHRAQASDSTSVTTELPIEQVQSTLPTEESPGGSDPQSFRS